MKWAAKRIVAFKINSTKSIGLARCIRYVRGCCVAGSGELEEVAGDDQLEDQEPRQQEGVHNHPGQGGGGEGGERRICYSTILPETMYKVKYRYRYVCNLTYYIILYFYKHNVNTKRAWL